MIHRLVGLALSPSFDTNLSNGSAVLRSDVSAEGMKSGRIFNGKRVVAIEDRLSLGIDLMIEQQNVGSERGQLRRSLG